MNVGALGGTAFIVLAVLLTAASVGKMGPAYAASRIGGLTSKDAATVAVLVNTRGLTELIALDIGLTTGLISGRLFTVLVLMAVLTTLMTAPLLGLRRTPATIVPAEQSSRESETGIA